MRDKAGAARRRSGAGFADPVLLACRFGEEAYLKRYESSATQVAFCRQLSSVLGAGVFFGVVFGLRFLDTQ
ncbi:MAG: hypothetical protein MPL62_06730 [Alphaproteobacteria bacterium]|nr:hypothetical protein [Alphaproteobacteria bacterium]